MLRFAGQPKKISVVVDSPKESGYNHKWTFGFLFTGLPGDRNTF